VVQPDAIRPAGQIEPAPRLDAIAHGEYQQRVPARVGDPAPRRRRAAVQARDVRGPDAGRSAAEQPPACVAQLEHALAAEQDDAAPAQERRDLASRTDRRGKLLRRSRAAAEQHRRRGQEQQRAEHATAAPPHGSAARHNQRAERAAAAPPHGSAARRKPRA
jgi:hypothetical protein